MRDGVVLRTNIWRPADGAAPTLLLRGPYGKDGTYSSGGPCSLFPSLLPFLNAGYAVVHQDVRGT
ncbi:X-Pro dipeptidyl-peptidase, partial [Pseudarthrobacter sp. AG30]